MSLIQTIECKTAKELMNYLHPSHSFWGTSRIGSVLHSGWIFRGQPDAFSNGVCCKLLPSAWRENNSTIESSRKVFEDGINLVGLKEENDKKVINYAIAEFALVAYFIILADRLGLYAPSFTKISNFDVEDFKHIVNPPYYLDIWEDIAFALAQHHGIPTRLLDWTYNAKKAAFFACKHHDSQESIAVYALKFSNSGDKISDNLKKISLVNVPKFESAYISSQEGIFTIDRSGDEHFARYGEYPSLDLTLDTYYDRKRATAYKFVLPKSEIKKLEIELKSEGIFRASLMPTYDNIAQEALQDIENLVIS